MPLVGPKKARALLEQFGTLDEVLAHAEEVNGKKLKENLVTFADQSRLSRRLVTLYDDLPLELDWDAQKVGHPTSNDSPRCSPNSDFDRSQPNSRTTGKTATPGSGGRPSRRRGHQAGTDAVGQQGQLFGQTDRRWTLVDTTGVNSRRFSRNSRNRRRFCFDLETTGLDELTADIVGWAFCWEPGHGWYLPVRGPQGSKLLDPDTVVMRCGR